MQICLKPESLIAIQNEALDEQHFQEAKGKKMWVRHLIPKEDIKAIKIKTFLNMQNVETSVFMSHHHEYRRG